jgi:transcriptional regulator with GAF, ATPase, and Fis domain
MTREIVQFHGTRVTSVMILPLGLGHKIVGGGSLLLVTEDDRKFTQEHVDLLSLLREPFAIAMSNALKHREILEDLWFRLNVFPILIPPLRERRSDVPALLQHFISLKTRELKLPIIPTLSAGAIDPLMEYHWPGNVRELQNVIERTLILNPSGPLTFEHLSFKHPRKTLEMREHGEETDHIDKVLSRHIRRVLSRAKGKVNGPDGAAVLLGINPSTLRNRMRKLGIDYGRKSKSRIGERNLKNA